MRRARDLGVRNSRRHGVLILFARAPALGRGKRRLARDIGDVGALRFYRGALARTLRLVAREEGWRGLVAIDPPSRARNPGPPFQYAGNARIHRIPQAPGDLGRRMAAALAAAPRGPAILIGADIVGVDAGKLRAALLACRAGDVVFGPATDGGFWLIGVKRAPGRRAFESVTWSAATTLDETLAVLPAGRRVRYAATLSDVDDAADLPASA